VLLVHWEGLEEIEASWERLSKLMRECPAVVQAYAKTIKSKKMKWNVAAASKSWCALKWNVAAAIKSWCAFKWSVDGQAVAQAQGRKEDFDAAI
ncbi:hypothetical protein AeNC1_017681, partial [Aphanomyces euteiches]